MPFTKENLMTLNSLSPEDVDQTLTAAELPLDKQVYEDEEIQARFDVIRNYFNSGQVNDYTAAAELFKQHQALQHSSIEQQPKNKKSTKGKKSGASNELSAESCERLNLLELIDLATKHCGVKVELLEAIQVMPNCGLLPNQSDFAPDECDRFVEACDQIKRQGKTIESVAAHFGMEGEVAAANNIEAGIEQTASALDSSGNGVVSEVMRYKAKVDASAAPSFYLQHLAEEFGSPEFQSAWGQMEEGLKASVLGKSQKRVRQMIGEQRSHPRSLPPSNILPSASED